MTPENLFKQTPISWS